MAEILKFESDKKRHSFPKDKVEVMAFNSIANTYDNDEMVDIKHWNGDCWKSFYEQIIVPQAERLGVDEWDYFATSISILFNGLRFETSDDGDMHLIMGED